jgi:hypothetical protein
VARAQIVVCVDQPDEVRAVVAWFDRWRDGLTAVSENSGCGCCVDIWDVEGPAGVLAELPEVVVAHPGIRA